MRKNKTKEVEHIQEIVAVTDIDVIFIGPTDLSNSLGFPGQPQHPIVQTAIERIIEAVRPSKAALGILVRDAVAARHWRERGVRFIVTTLESIMLPAVRNYLDTVLERQTSNVKHQTADALTGGKGGA